MNPDRERLLRLAESEDGCPIGVGGLMAKPTKVLFLDVDGVLNSRFVINERRRADVIDTTMCRRIQAICNATGCKLVISSTWRLYHPLSWLGATFRLHGLSTDIIGKTDDLVSEELNRTDEILAWLKNHPEVTQFVAIDDDQLDRLPNNFVKTTFEDGIQDEHVEKAIAILGRV